MARLFYFYMRVIPFKNLIMATPAFSDAILQFLKQTGY